MRNTGIFTYYRFGYNFAILHRDGLAGFDTKKAISLLDEFFQYTTDLDLQVTAGVAQRVRELTDSLRTSTDERVSSSAAAAIAKEFSKIDPTLDAELQLKLAFVLTKKRYPLDTLLKTPEELLGRRVFDSLCDNCQKDFRLGCRQIALNQATSAAFHLMRALEAHVKELYFAFKKTQRLEKPMWGPMTGQLRTKKSPKPSTMLLDHLDGMRNHFRNPTQHPDKFYTMDEAQDLLNQTMTALNMISAELPKPKKVIVPS